MSGLEFAGLALAILPIVMSAIDHYKNAAEHSKDLTSDKNSINRQLDFYSDLNDELALLNGTLNGVAHGFPLRVGGVVSSPLTAHEKEEIARVLGDNAMPFQTILERLLKSLEALISDKSFKADDLMNFRSPGSLFEKLERFKSLIERGETTKSIRKRFQFTRNEKSRTVALRKIQDANVKLERLLRGSLLPKLKEFGPSRTKKPHSTRLRRLSEPLFNKIAGKWPKACECHSQHEARLCLWNCCSSQRDQSSRDSLDMMVSVTDVKNDGSPWQQSTILVVEHSKSPRLSPVVRFADHESPSSTPPGRDIDSDSLCNLIHQAHGRKSTLQIVFDQEKLWQIQSRKRSLSLEKQKDLSLKDLLHDPDHHIRLKEQRILAVTLAHAALHCSDGPWLGEDWSKEHITFFTNDPSGEPDLSRPFLKVRFEAGLKRTDDDCDLFNLHTNPALLSLGILLLEIYLKGPIESRWSPEDLDEGEPNENTNLTTAIRLLQDAEGEIYEGYRKAVRACLQSDIQDVDADELRRKVYQEIVWPLEQELDHGFHIKPEDLQLAPAGFV